jgi:hypothetical protein
MKKIILSTMLSLFSSLAFADLSYSLPAVSDIRVVVEKGPAVAAVEPRATLKFKYASCAVQSLDVDVKENPYEIVVEIRLPGNALDCMGLAKDREYSFQISSQFNGQKVIVNNPTIVTDVKSK